MLDIVFICSSPTSLLYSFTDWLHHPWTLISSSCSGDSCPHLILTKFHQQNVFFLGLELLAVMWRDVFWCDEILTFLWSDKTTMKLRTETCIYSVFISEVVEHVQLLGCVVPPLPMLKFIFHELTIV